MYMPFAVLYFVGRCELSLLPLPCSERARHSARRDRGRDKCPGSREPVANLRWGPATIVTVSGACCTGKQTSPRPATILLAAQKRRGCFGRLYRTHRFLSVNRLHACANPNSETPPSYGRNRSRHGPSIRLSNALYLTTVRPIVSRRSTRRTVERLLVSLYWVGFFFLIARTESLSLRGPEILCSEWNSLLGSCASQTT